MTEEAERIRAIALKYFPHVFVPPIGGVDHYLGPFETTAVSVGQDLNEAHRQACVDALAEFARSEREVGRREGIEQAIAANCTGCAAGHPLENGIWHNWILDDGTNSRSTMLCESRALRALAAPGGTK